MATYLPLELQTKVIGKEGLVLITQINEANEELEIVLTVHQFEEIINHSKSVIKEAWDFK